MDAPARVGRTGRALLGAGLIVAALAPGLGCGDSERPASGSAKAASRPPPFAQPACLPGATEARTAEEVRDAVADGDDVCVTAAVGDVDLTDLGELEGPHIGTRGRGSLGHVDLKDTSRLTLRARFRSTRLSFSHEVTIESSVIGGSRQRRVPDQLIFMPDVNDDVRIERNEIAWTVADDSGNTGYGCRCYGELNRLRFVGNHLHDLAADAFQGVGGADVLVDRNEIGPVGRNPGSGEHSDSIQITGNGPNLRVVNNWIHHQGYYEGEPTANAGSTYIHGGGPGSLLYANNLIETTQGRTEICGLGTGGDARNRITIRNNTWTDGGRAFPNFPSFEWDCDSGKRNRIIRNIAIDPDGGFADNGYDAAIVSPNIFGKPSSVTLDADGNCTSANCNPAGQEPIGYRKPSGVHW